MLPPQQFELTLQTKLRTTPVTCDDCLGGLLFWGAGMESWIDPVVNVTGPC